MVECFIALGSNLGDRLATLGLAVARLRDEPGFALRRVSHSYETEPVGPPQPRYLNAVAQVGTLLSPRATLSRLQQIEEQLGRLRREKWGSREIDLDLLLYGDRELRETGLTLPHPLYKERAFVLVPLCEISPQHQPLLDALPQEARLQVRRYRSIRPPLPEPEAPDEEK
jgi:2-amino-4-hydroxy-6-hydroxymethyldihydropteridine diphosphokinase